jgi:hypothetical protein
MSLVEGRREYNMLQTWQYIKRKYVEYPGEQYSLTDKIQWNAKFQDATIKVRLKSEFRKFAMLISLMAGNKIWKKKD